MQTTDCPSRQQLRSYLFGKLADNDSEVVQKHLEQCQACESVATDLEDDPDTFAGLLCSADDSSADAERDYSLSNLHALVNPELSSIGKRNAIGSYELLEPLGRGGMGTVYRAQHKELGKQVAIKLLPTLSAKNEDVVSRFRRETRASGSLEHPSIVQATDAGIADGVHFLVMEAVDGLDLSRVARLSGKMSAANASEIIRQAALGLEYAHSQGVVHRDVKPSNLMLDANGKVKILDFGLAQMSVWEGASELTTVGQLMGTLDYMAPEQAARDGSVDYRADVYSLGATLFRLLAGRPPLTASPNVAPLEKLRLLGEHKHPRLTALRPDIPDELAALVDEMLSRDPLQRPISCAHVAERLEAFADSADLASLLATARKAASRGEDWGSRVGLAESAEPNQHAASLSTTAPPRISLPWWIAGSLFAAATFAGVLFVMETTKGQLVIESEVADVHVRLVRDYQTAGALRIETGAKSTRLSNGTYELVIDSPSDAVLVSDGEFDIQRGDLIVARIRSSSIVANEKASKTEVDPALPSATPDPRKEPMYNGETLSEWLDVLRTERELTRVSDALNALHVFADDETSPRIFPVLRALIPKVPFGTCSDSALSLLEKTAPPDRFFLALTEIIDSSASRIRAELLQADYYFGDPKVQPESAAPLLKWAQQQLENDAVDVDEKMAIGDLLLSVSHNLFRGSSVEEGALRVQVIALLNATPPLETRFWLSAPEGHVGDSRFPRRWQWSAEFRQAVRQKCFELLAAETCSLEDYVRAAMIVSSTASSGEEFQDEDAFRVVPVLRKRLAELSSKAFSFSSIFQHSAAPELECISWHMNRPGNDSVQVTPAFVLLNLVGTLGVEDAMDAQLSELTEALQPFSNLLDTRISRDFAHHFMQKSPIDISFLWSRDEPADFRDFLLHCQLIELEGLNVRDALESAIKKRDDQRKRATEQKSRIIEPGDTLAIYIEGILPYSTPDRMVDPPLVQAGKNSPVWGFPVTVDANGQIVLPLIGNVPLEGVEIASAAKQIHQHYVDKHILPAERRSVISLSMLRKSGHGLEIRMLSGAKDKEPSSP